MAHAASDKWNTEKRYLRRLQRRYNAIVRELPEPEKLEDALQRTEFFKEFDRDVTWKKGSIPAALKYRRMLHRIKRSEKHAKYAPWFEKSEMVKLNRVSAKIYGRVEKYFTEKPVNYIDDDELLADLIQKRKALEEGHVCPKTYIQSEIQEAFLDCDFEKPRQDSIHIVNRPPKKVPKAPAK